MELIVQFDGREERLEVERRGALWSVRCGDRRYEVEAVASGPRTRSLVVEGRQHEVQILTAGPGTYRVTTPRGSETVEVSDPLTWLAREARAEAGGRSGGRVDAYMPGRVVAVLVEEGAAVEAGQGVVVLEAMKMENEIHADHAGVVTRLHVTPGQAVEGGDPLFELES